MQIKCKLAPVEGAKKSEVHHPIDSYYVFIIYFTKLFMLVT
jgi:hypothetical protein